MIGRDFSDDNVIASVDELTLNAEQEVLATVPFFVPDQATVDGVRDLVERGVRAAAFTNSLATNSQTVAHTGFKPMRKPLLQAGGEIYELRSDAVELQDIVNTPPVVAEEVGLHAKFIVVDRERVYVGSLNLDPRSIYVNTELGLLIEDPILAEQLAAIFERNASGANSWKAFLDEKGDVDWVSNLGTLEWQPAKGEWQRFQARMLGLLPIKKQL
jgi:putative cardiolipin synthase